MADDLPDEDALLKELGQVMRTARKQAGLLQRELAHMTGYSRSSIANAEMGHYRIGRDFYERADAILGTSLVHAYEVFWLLRAERLGAALAATAADGKDQFQECCEEIVKAVALRVPDHTEIVADVAAAWRNGISMPQQALKVVVKIRVLDKPG